ncbi:65-kDa microtubule-associated protein 3 [Acorus calamus]|uniref:65-kDa microtubule-associated protein 3 n=1 Tax=Acorus calamus TaxID=4465 RepID=A0AAV9DXV4_ACOCL|nr:65-kDa microtubule-associated protein 3 [Acorus calamus]
MVMVIIDGSTVRTFVSDEEAFNKSADEAFGALDLDRNGPNNSTWKISRKTSSTQSQHGDERLRVQDTWILRGATDRVIAAPIAGERRYLHCLCRESNPDMPSLPSDQLLQMETTCGSFLYELQIIWDEVGVSDADRDKMIFELEQECLEVYRRKVDVASRCRAQLRQEIADSEAELAAICSAMGERPVHLRKTDQSGVSLKEELKAIVPQLEEMRKRKSDRRIQFLEVLEKIQKASVEIGSVDVNMSMMVVDETDLSLKRLEELQKQLQALQKEKADRLNKVLERLSTLNSLCLVLGMDFKCTVGEVHPSLGDSDGSKNISNDTIEKLGIVIERLRKIKIQRMQKVEAEVSRLEELKASKMKELVLKKKAELEDLRRKTHMVVESDSAMEYAIEAIESGAIDPGCVLEQIEDQIATVKEEAFSRKEILEKVEKWLALCEEECWLEEYNRDENRYNAGRGAHLTLNRAEKARAAVNKLPAIVEALASKTIAWEKDKGVEFKYDGIHLLSMLEEYTILRQEKEQERRRQRDQKKLQGQLIAEHEVLYGSKPSPSKTPGPKKVPRMSTGGANRRLSLGGASLQPLPKFDSSHSIRSIHAIHPAKKLDEGTRGMDIAGLATKKHSFVAPSAREADVPIQRKPFTPVTPVPCENNGRSFVEDPNRPKQTPNQIGSPLKTPSKPSSVTAFEEAKTPRMMQIPPPKTPMTASVPMQATDIAASPLPPSSLFGNTAVTETTQEEMEYSFEERRAGFILPRTHLKPVHLN